MGEWLRHRAFVLRMEPQSLSQEALVPETSYEQRDYLLSPAQAVRLLALADMLGKGDLAIRGHEQEDEQGALSLIADIGQELALQFGGPA